VHGGVQIRGRASLAAGALAALASVALAPVVAGAGHPTHADTAHHLRIGEGRGGIRKHKVGSFASPTYVAQAPGAPHFLYVVQQGGRVRVVDHGNVRGQPFLDIHGRVSSGGERGLLSIAFDPHYGRNHHFYAYYTNAFGNIEIDEFRAASNSQARKGSRRKVIVIPHPGEGNHNGGQLQFGPDGRLYAATGDGGGAGDPHENAQNKQNLLGKLLRIDPRQRGSKRYKSPRGNPFVGKAGRNEIYALGLRNPFRFSFDRRRILIGDVGQSRWEEVDFEGHRALRGANFGWDHFEGDHRFNYPGDNEAPRPKHRYRPPIFEYRHTASNCESAGGCAIIGGYVVRQPALGSLRGRYLYADAYKGQLRSFVPHRHHGTRDRALGVHVDHPSSFGKGARGRIYVTSLDGPVYRLVHK
jgi:glucose/arabinose dehydrogenase